MRYYFRGAALYLAILISTVLFFTQSIIVHATEDAEPTETTESVVTDLSNPEFGEVTDITLPDSVSGEDDIFSFGFSFHINDAGSFPDGTFTYTLPYDLDFSDIVDTQIQVARGEEEIGYAVIGSDNVITFHVDPEKFKNDPNGIDGNVAITCKLGENVSEDDEEVEIHFSDKLVYKIVINNSENPENPEEPEPGNPENPEDPDPNPGVDPGFTASLEKEAVKRADGTVRDPATGMVDWTSKLTVIGEDEGRYTISVKDTITPENADDKGGVWLNSKRLAARIVKDSVAVYAPDGSKLENAKVTYNSNSFTVDIENLPVGEYTITYSTYDYYDQTDNHILPEGSNITFNNTISVVTPGIDASAKASYQVTTEGLPMRKYAADGKFDSSNGTYVIPWTVYVNRNAFNQSNDSIQEGVDASVTDTLPVGLHFLPDSVVMTDSSGNAVPLETSLEDGGEQEILTWKFTWGNAKFYKITFKSFVSKEDLENKLNSSDNGILTLSYINTVNAVVGNAVGEVSAKTNQKIKLLEKSAEFDGSAQQINYSIVINEKGVMLNGGKEITLSDEVTNGTFVTESLKILDYNTGEEIALEEAKILFSQQNTKLALTVPDGRAFIVKYSVKADTTAGVDSGDGKITVEVSNNAILNATSQKKSSTQDKYKTNKVSASVSSKNGSVIITKKEKNNPAKNLGGAVINLYKVDLNSGESQLVSEKTTVDPLGFVKFSEDGSYNSLIFDTLYYYQEVTAPKGYKLDSSKHYFMFAYNKYESIKDKIDSYVEGAEFKLIDVKTQGSEFEAVLENEIETTVVPPTPDPTPGNNDNPGDNPGGNDPGNNPGGNDPNPGNPGSDNPVSSGTSSVTTTSATVAVAEPGVLGATRERYPESVPEMGQVLGARRSPTGDTNTTRDAVLIIMAAVAGLALAAKKKNI